MQKKGRINLTIDKVIKEEAESVLKNMGFSPAIAIEIFYRQIIFQRKMPFEIKCADPGTSPLKNDAS